MSFRSRISKTKRVKFSGKYGLARKLHYSNRINKDESQSFYLNFKPVLDRYLQSGHTVLKSERKKYKTLLQAKRNEIERTHDVLSNSMGQLLGEFFVKYIHSGKSDVFDLYGLQDAHERDIAQGTKNEYKGYVRELSNKVFLKEFTDYLFFVAISDRMKNVLMDSQFVSDVVSNQSRFSELEQLCAYQLSQFAQNTDLMPRDDLLQEGRLVIWKCAEQYNGRNLARFKSLTKTSLNNRLTDILRASQTKKRCAWNKTVLVGTSSYADNLANKGLVLSWLANQREQDALSGENVPREVIGALSLAGLESKLTEILSIQEKSVYADLLYHCYQRRVSTETYSLLSCEEINNEENSSQNTESNSEDNDFFDL